MTWISSIVLLGAMFLILAGLAVMLHAGVDSLRAAETGKRERWE
jgi:hypothetical protein